MSVETTLAAFKYVIGAALPSWHIYTTPQIGPYRGKFPGFILTEFHDQVARTEAGVKGNQAGKPNIYSWVYLLRTAADMKNLTQAESDIIVHSLRLDMETLKTVFQKKSNQTLNAPDTVGVVGPSVMIAGEDMIFEYDREGLYVNYLNQIFVGVWGAIDVMENYRFDIYT